MKYIIVIIIFLVSTIDLQADRDVQIVSVDVAINYGNVEVGFDNLVSPVGNQIVRYELIYYPSTYPGWSITSKPWTKSKNGSIYNYVVTNGYIQPYKHTMAKIVAYTYFDEVVYESNMFVVYATTQSEIIKVQFPY